MLRRPPARWPAALGLAWPPPPLATIEAMDSLEQRVRELTAHAVARAPSVLDAATGGTPLKGSQREVNGVVMGALSGIHAALIEIAREIDALRSEL